VKVTFNQNINLKVHSLWNKGNAPRFAPEGESGRVVGGLIVVVVEMMVF
jgi:hypothetical protein